MSDQPDEHPIMIPQETLLRRLEQSEDLRDFAIQVWLQNPELARQGGAKIQDLLAPLAPYQPPFRQGRLL